MTLQIDNRVGSRDLYPLLTACCSHKIELTSLQSGDAAWAGYGPDEQPVLVGVERKQIHDLMSSKDSGRLSGTQLVAMGNHYNYVYLAVEGLWRAGESGLLEVWQRGRWREMAHGRRRYTVKEVNKFLNTLAVKCGVMVEKAGRSRETAMWIADIYAWWQEPWGSHKSHKMKQAVASRMSLDGSKTSRLARMLQEIDGVGLDRAEAVAAEFGSMGALVQYATADYVAGIVYGKRKDGAILHVGKITAEKIINQLFEEG